MKNITYIPSIVGVVLGLIFYEIGNTIQYLVIPFFFPNLLRLIGFITIVCCLKNATYNHLNGKVSVVFFILIVWTIIMSLRGSLIGNYYIPGQKSSFIQIFLKAFLSPFGAFSYFIPLVALIKVPYNSFYYLKKIAIILCFVSLVMTFWKRNEIANGLVSSGLTSIMEQNGMELTVRHLTSALYPGFGIILLFLFLFNYINGKILPFIFPLAIIIFFLNNAIGGGRAQTGLSLIYLFLFLFINFYYPFQHGKIFKSKGNMTKTFHFLILGIVLAYFLYYLYTNTIIFDYLLKRSFGDKTLSGEFNTSGRDILRKDMINDFNNNPLDWIWGRGVNGAYNTHFLSINGFRTWMEWGYLYLILKGGIVYLILFTYCMLHAAYLGFFKSNNTFSKKLAAMCVVLLINLVSVGAEPQMSTLFLISWICFGLLEQKQLRIMSDETIFCFFNYKNYNPT